MEKELTRKDFTRIDLDKDDHYYYSFKTERMEICIEPCAGGFCVAPYTLATDPLDQDIIEPRKCTNCDGFLKSFDEMLKEENENVSVSVDIGDTGHTLGALLGERNEKVWEKALVIANDIHKRLG